MPEGFDASEDLLLATFYDPVSLRASGSGLVAVDADGSRCAVQLICPICIHAVAATSALKFVQQGLCHVSLTRGGGISHKESRAEVIHIQHDLAPV